MLLFESTGFTLNIPDGILNEKVLVLLFKVVMQKCSTVRCASVVI